jgi:ATP-dependent DNA ligase
MHSKSGQNLSRYFPEVVVAALSLREQCFGLDGEIVIPVGSGFSFDRSSAAHPSGRQPRKKAFGVKAGFVSCI